MTNSILCSYADARHRATGQVGKVLGERWKALNEKQRQPYEAKAATDKKRYEDQKASYNVSSEPVDGPEEQSRLTDRRTGR